MKTKQHKGILLIIITLLYSLLYSGLVSSYFAETIIPTVSGDDPGIELGTPAYISSREQVELSILLSSSAGNIDQDGAIKITMPQSIVQNKNDLLDNLVIDSPFYLDKDPVKTDNLGNYILSISYDHTNINQGSAVGAKILVKFSSPVIREGDTNIPDKVVFKTDLYKGAFLISHDEESSIVNRLNGSLPLFNKWSTRPQKVVNGTKAALMSVEDPTANIFVITVNYNQQEFSNVKLIDSTPSETQLIDAKDYLVASGDKTPIEHIQIAKVTSRKEDGTPNRWEYVTESLKDKIEVTSSYFEINFGDLTTSDSYVVIYSEEVTAEDVTQGDFGVRYNKAQLYSDEAVLKELNVPLAIDEPSYSALALTKTVNQRTLSTTNGELDYSLTLESFSGVIKAGTVITDPLPEKTNYDSTLEKDDSFFSEGIYDVENRTISYTVIKDISAGSKQTIRFSLEYDDPNAHFGDKIINRAYITHGGTNIYSNDVTTTLEGSAYLTKLDAETDLPLVGAVFCIVNEEGTIIAENLITSEAGIIHSELLHSGKYRFIETKAPDGYILDKTPIEFEVVPGQENPIFVKKENTKSSSNTNSNLVELLKVDEETKESLSNASFDIFTVDDHLLFKNLVTDKEGKIVLRNLPDGDYYFVERDAPYGYILESSPLPFTVHAEVDETIRLVKTNRKLLNDTLPPFTNEDNDSIEDNDFLDKETSVLTPSVVERFKKNDEPTNTFNKKSAISMAEESGEPTKESHKVLPKLGSKKIESMMVLGCVIITYIGIYRFYLSIKK